MIAPKYLTDSKDNKELNVNSNPQKMRVVRMPIRE